MRAVIFPFLVLLRRSFRIYKGCNNQAWTLKLLILSYFLLIYNLYYGKYIAWKFISPSLNLFPPI